MNKNPRSKGGDFYNYLRIKYKKRFVSVFTNVCARMDGNSCFEYFTKKLNNNVPMGITIKKVMGETIELA
jgi:hypothetical protein